MTQGQPISNESARSGSDVLCEQPLNHRYIGGLRTFWVLRDFEFYLIALSQGKSFTLNSSAMNEYIFSVFHFNKPKAPLVTKPFDSPLHHYNLPSKSDL